MSEHMILIGARGWRHPVWREEYYPDGLPEDWQLGFYGNEYRVMLVPASYWQDTNIDVHQWLEDTDESLQFLSEWPAEPAAQQRAREGMAILGGRAIGFVISLTTPPGDEDLTIYKELQANSRLCFDLGQLAPAQAVTTRDLLQQALGKDAFGIVWHGQAEQALDLQQGSLAVTRIKQVKDARDLRRIIEANLAVCREGRVVALIIDGDPPDIQLMQNAGIILDLL